MPPESDSQIWNVAPLDGTRWSVFRSGEKTISVNDKDVAHAVARLLNCGMPVEKALRFAKQLQAA